MLLYTCLASTASNLKHIISNHFYMQTMETYFYLGLSGILIGPSHDSCREKSVVHFLASIMLEIRFFHPVSMQELR